MGPADALGMPLDGRDESARPTLDGAPPYIEYVAERVREMALHAGVSEVTMRTPGAKRDLRAIPSGYQFFYRADDAGRTAESHLVAPHMGCLVCFGCWAWEHRWPVATPSTVGRAPQNAADGDPLGVSIP